MVKKQKINWVSVIIPTYNRAKKLPRCVQSCLTQTHKNVEAIVIDDGSNDETPVILNDLEEQWGKNHFRWIRQKNQGACIARNVGLDLACGEFIQFLDSDDFLLPMKFEQQILALRKCDFPVAVCDFKYVSEKTNVSLHSKNNSGNLWEKLADFKSISIFSPLIRSDSIPESLRWNPTILRNQDMDFMLRYFLSIQGWVYTPGFWCFYMMHEDDQLSDTYNKGSQYKELYISLITYWKNNKKIIPATNSWVVRQFTLKMAQYLERQGKKNIAVSLGQDVMQRPFSRKRSIDFLKILLRFIIPAWLRG